MSNIQAHSPHPASLFENSKLDGIPAVELLPWALNGSLDADEAAGVAELLEGGALDAELAATGEMFWLTGQHVPTLTLAEYALDLPTSELSRDEIAGHLEGCAACRAELELIAADEASADEDAAADLAPVVAFPGVRPAAPRPTGRPMRRRLALAAVLATAVAGALLFQIAQIDPGQIGHGLGAPNLDGASAVVADAQVMDEAATHDVHTSPPDAALFFDGFESGDTGSWTIASH